MVDAMLHDEEGRLSALHRLDALDTPAEEPFEKIVNLVRAVLSVPMATVTLVASDRQWFKAHRGMPSQETPRSISFCTHTIQERGALVVTNAMLDPRFANSPLVTGAPYIRSYAGIPLRTPDGYNVGALCAIDTNPRAFSDAEIAILTNLASIVMDELELRMIAGRDHLTGALTRRGFMEEAEKELSRHDRNGRASALALLDVDHFKSINDTHGHPAGDQVLRQLAEVCSTVIRPTDSFGRIGGEEFALLLTDVEVSGAFAAAERVRSMIEAHPFKIGDGRALKVTASFGVAPLDATVATVDAWLATADASLYRAKRDGRNRTRLAVWDDVAVAI
jgi:diguanylate cyclase (GGDEF)-like protein